MLIPILLVWLGYGTLSYGYVLIKGWDIPPREWWSPINAYQWPKGNIPTVPKGHIFPTGSSSGGGGAAAMTGPIGAMPAPSNNLYPTLPQLGFPQVNPTRPGGPGRPE
jgi:hypothetical protein